MTIVTGRLRQRLAHVMARLRSRPPARPADDARARYRTWAARQAPTTADLTRMREAAGQFAFRPLISIVTPVYNTDARWLRACIASVRRQAYPNWELCICDDASTSPDTREALAEGDDARVKIVRLERNAHISAASNAALALATGEFVGFLDHDDELTPDALFEVVAHLNRAPDTDIVYSDEDKLDADGGYSDAYFKPDWSPDHLLGAMYTCHFTVARRALIGQVGGFREGYEGSQDHDLILRLSEATTRIHHLPKVLYHWRRTPESAANTGTEKSWAHDAGMRAVADAMRRRGVDATVMTGGVPGLYRVKFAIPGPPLVSVVVVNPGTDARAAQACADRFRAETAYPAVEIAIAGRGAAATTADVVAATRASRGVHLAFVDAALEAADPGWLSAMVEYSQQDAIGAVGAKICYADGRLRHIGLLLGVGPGVARAMHGEAGSSYGYFSSAIGVRNYSAVSGECLVTRRAVFDQLGGVDPLLPWSVADVDYCLKARRADLRVVFTPYAQLRVRRDASPAATPDPAALSALAGRWGSSIADDPAYNPNLTPEAPDYALRM